MIQKDQRAKLLESMVEVVELPVSAYEKAKKRYDDLGEWFSREESQVNSNEPHIFPQGSFRLGTVIRPLHEKEAYDLDLSCKLARGLSKDTCTQEELKKLVGCEIESYRVARNIKSPKEEKHRCWRLEYQDELSFHMDIVPGLPADTLRSEAIFMAMQKEGEDREIAESLSRLAVNITDDRHPEYKEICDEWHLSNTEGYAQWFESRILHRQRGHIYAKAQVDDLPIYKKRTSLQRAIQLLKRHRDHMFREDADVKPISIIISTLASRAYQGEPDLFAAIDNILSNMSKFIRKNIPRVPNPVNPAEDFADRWRMQPKLNLEQNFWCWLEQAKADFNLICSREDAEFISKQAQEKFSIRLNADEITKRLSLSSLVTSPKEHLIANPAKPWGSYI